MNNPSPGFWAQAKAAPVAYGFTAICVVAYAATLVFGGVRSGGGGFGFGGTSNEALWASGALDSQMVLRFGQWDRVAASAVLHAGLMHIAFNGWALLKLGPVLDWWFGARRALAVYGASAIGASAFKLGFDAAFDKGGMAVGASGVVCGVISALCVLLYKSPEPHLLEWRRHLVASLVMCLAIGLLPGIAFSAHAGGAVGGALVALRLRRESPAQRSSGRTPLALAGVGMAVVFLVGLAIAAFRAPERLEVFREAVAYYGRGTGR